MPETEVFLGRAKVETFRRDVDRVRRAIRRWDAEETEKAWEKLERWLSCVNPNKGDVDISGGSCVDGQCRREIEGGQDG